MLRKRNALIAGGTKAFVLFIFFPYFPSTRSMCFSKKIEEKKGSYYCRR
jgi:hypothetical protein